jgi:ribosomal protein L29
MMNISEIRKLTKEEITTKANELVSELRKVKTALKSGELSGENINKHRELKKTIAKLKTVLTELSLLNK